MMGVLCKLGLHKWEDGPSWGTRACSWCQHVEVRRYDKDTGSSWERVT
jgi:hypothetical protein